MLLAIAASGCGDTSDESSQGASTSSPDEAHPLQVVRAGADAAATSATRTGGSGTASGVVRVGDADVGDADVDASDVVRVVDTDAAASDAVRGDADQTSDANGPGIDVTRDGGDSSALWCAVQQLSLQNCAFCHDGKGTAGAPMALVTYADFMADAPLSQGMKTYEAVAARVHDSARPMPPGGLLSDADLQVIDRWIAAGAPAGSNPDCATADAGDTSVVRQ